MICLTSCQPNNYGEKYQVDKFEVFYSEGVKKEEVKSLHKFFKSHDLIGDSKQSIQISALKDKYILKLVRSKGTADMPVLPEYRTALRDIAKQISEEVFDGTFVELHLASNTFKTTEIIA